MCVFSDVSSGVKLSLVQAVSQQGHKWVLLSMQPVCMKIISIDGAISNLAA